MKKICHILLVFLLILTTMPISNVTIQAEAATDAPTGLTATADDGEVKLEWNRAIGNGKTMLYIGDDIPSDHKSIAHLETLGFQQIDLMRAKEVTTEDAEGYDIVFVGEGGGSADIGQKFMNVDIPVVYAKGWVVDDVHLSESISGSSGDIDGQTEITIQEKYHPLAAGLSGNVEVYNQAGKVNFGTPGEDATVIATVNGDPNKATIFAYDKGDKRVNGETIPAKRVLTFLHRDKEDHMTELGWKLLDASIAWALDAEEKKKMLYIGNDISADVKTYTHLDALGYLQIDFAQAKTVTTEDTEGYDIVFVAESGGSGDIGQKFMHIPIPVVYAKGWVVDDVHLSESTSGASGDIDGQTAIQIQNASHPLAAGLSGEVEVYTQAGKVNFGTPGEEADVIATVVNDDTKSTIFAYEKGAKRVNGEAVPERRVSTFLFRDQEDFMTNAGWKLFDTSIGWALDLQPSELPEEKTFTVKRSLTPGGPYEVIATGVKGTSFTDQKVTNGTTYYYTISLMTGTSESDASEEVHATPVESLPAPTGVIGMPGNGEVTISWDAVEEATVYDVWRSVVDEPDAYQMIANNLTETSYTDQTVINGNDYYYVITAGNDVTTSKYSTAVQVTPVDTSPIIELIDAPVATNKAEYVLKGMVDQASTVTINSQVITLADNHSFTHTLQLIKGKNTITIEAVNENNEAAAPVIHTVIYETDAPVLTLDELVGEEKGEYVETVYNPYPISGVLNESGNVLINGEEIEVNDDYTFYTEVKLSPAIENTITIEAIDDAGNKSELIEISIFPVANAVPPGPIEIESAEVIEESKVKVTFNGKVEHFDTSDISLEAALGTWDSFNPKLSPYFTITNTTTGTTESGKTYVIFETEEKINLDGTFEREVTEDPHHVPYLRASYYSDDLEASIQQADYLLTWQIEHGGWDKNKSDTLFRRAWDGTEPRSESYSFIHDMETGTIDNNATIDEILFLALMYKETGYEQYKESVLKGIEFLQNMQYDTGGFAQAYPLNGSYQDNVTFNDNAMTRVLEAMTLMAERQYPFNTDLIDDELAKELQSAVDLATDYLLNSQIIVDGKRTAWGQQHDPFTYEPTTGRPFEVPSISGFESVAIVKYLMSLPDQTAEIKEAIDGAIQWFEEVEVHGYRFERFDETEQYYYEDENSSYWYRLYEIGTNLPIFTQRENELVTHDIMDLKKENRSSYMWAGDFARDLLDVAHAYGYFENQTYIKVIGTNSTNISGETFTLNTIERVGPMVEEDDEETPTIPEEEPEDEETPTEEEGTETDKENDKEEDGKDESTKQDDDVTQEETSDETDNESQNESDNEEILPNTATNMFNWLLVGGAILVIGTILFVIQRRKLKS
ncbi:pectate lyase [Gracilibacillus marinus]|uniref:Pectate lyase n=1 Tax=Gracilibacillus marinus TaxID=630535 RepID=A0ABV8VQG8_9BACI